MAASITPKFQRYNALTIEGPTLSYDVTQWEGVVSWTEPEPAALVAYNGNEFAAVVKGQVQMTPITFTVNFTQFTITEALIAELLDVLKRRGSWVAEGSVAPGSFSNFDLSDLTFTAPGIIFDEQADAVAKFERVRYVSHAFAAGDPNTLAISLECYGTITETGSVPA